MGLILQPASRPKGLIWRKIMTNAAVHPVNINIVFTSNCKDVTFRVPDQAAIILKDWKRKKERKKERKKPVRAYRDKCDVDIIPLSWVGFMTDDLFDLP